MISVTFIRHGESTDNLRPIWAGWLDGPLSNHGMNQANALGSHFSSTRFTEIYTSPLKRAYSTALAIQAAQPTPHPPLSTSPLLREQHFGIAEGKAWIMKPESGLSLSEHYARGIYPTLHSRCEKFAEGESLDDLTSRAQVAVREIVLPYVWKAARHGRKDPEGLAIVSHGLTICEMVAALVRLDHSGREKGKEYKGLKNTAWTRVEVAVKGAREGEKLEFSDDDPPPLVVSVMDFNCHEHLNNVKRQKGGIGSAAHDPKQQKLTAFFGGGDLKNGDLEQCESNAYDDAES